MYKVHGFVDDKMVLNQRMEHIPNVGDTMRFAGERYAKVLEVIWCMDEETTSFEGQRINLRMETEKRRKMRKQARLFCCMHCEWIYKGDPGECPKCGWPSYSAHYVYGERAYRYAKTQKPWKDKKMASYEFQLNKIIQGQLP
jgi:hypothetical protein